MNIRNILLKATIVFIILSNLANAQTKFYSIKAVGSTVFAGSSEGLYLTTNNGQSWDKIDGGLPNGSEVKAIGVNNSGMFAGTYKDGLYTSKDLGKTWTRINNLPINFKLIETMLVNDSAIYMTGLGQGIIASFDNGKSWVPADKGINSGNIRTIKSYDTCIYVGTSDQGVFLSVDKGRTWSEINTGLTSKNISALAFNNSKLYSGCDNGEIFYYDNEYGWSKIDGPKVKTISSLLISNPEDYLPTIFAGTKEEAFYAKNGEAKWYENAHPYLVNNPISTFEIADSGLFVGTLNGIYFFPSKLLYGVLKNPAFYTKKSEEKKEEKKEERHYPHMYSNIGEQDDVILKAEKYGDLIIFEIENKNSKRVSVTIKLTYECESKSFFGSVTYQKFDFKRRISVAANSIRSYDTLDDECAFKACDDFINSWKIAAWTVSIDN